MSVIRYVDCFQGHPVPKTAHRPKGPFPAELYAQPEIINDYEKPYSDDGSNFNPGSTAQNNFQGWRWLRCYECNGRVREDETEDHECEE
jgi:hypothetical protein